MLPSLARDEIEIALRIRSFQVDRGWDDTARDRQRSHHRFESAGGTQQVAGHGLGGAHHQPAGVAVEHRFDRAHFHRISGGRRGPMGVDVIHFFGRHAGVLERARHRARGSAPVLARSGQVEGIGRCAVAGELAENRGAAPPGMILALEDQHAGAFAHHEAVPILVEGPARSLRVVVTCRKGA